MFEPSSCEDLSPEDMDEKDGADMQGPYGFPDPLEHLIGFVIAQPKTWKWFHPWASPYKVQTSPKRNTKGDDKHTPKKTGRRKLYSKKSQSDKQAR